MARERSTIDKLIKRQIKLTILSVIAVVLITSTITYALYQTNHENTTDQVISIGNLGLTATGTPITLEGLYPMEEYDLTSSYPRYEFTLENKTNGVNNDYTLMYELILRADESSTLTQDDYQYIMYKIDGSDTKALSEVWDSEINGFKILDGRLLSNAEATGTFLGKDKENHSVVFWLNTYAPNSVQGKVLTLKMSLEAYADRFNHLRAAGVSSTNVFGKTLNRSDFEIITLLDKIDIPSNTIDYWDVSAKQNKSIMAWYTDEDNNDLYELYIGQFRGVIAPPDCICLFSNYTNVVSIENINDLDTRLVTEMGSSRSQEYGLFSNCQRLKNLDLSNWDTSNVTNMSHMFNMCISLENLDLSNFDITNLSGIGLYNTFTNCASLKKLDLSSFKNSNLSSMMNAFLVQYWLYSSKLEEIDLSNFETENITQWYQTFTGLTKLKKLKLNKATFNHVTSYTNMFDTVSGNIKIITNECAEEFVRARLADANRSSVTLEVLPCVKVCYSNNLNNLPLEYTELDYIESTGTQYIDTGYIPKTTTKLELDLSFGGTYKTPSVTGNEILFGVKESGNSFEVHFGGSVSTSNNLYGFFNIPEGLAGAVVDRLLDVSNIKNSKNRLIIDLSNNSYSYGTNNVAISTKKQNNTESMIIFGVKDKIKSSNYPFTAYNMKVYKMKIYENGTLIRNYIPALRKSDNTIGLYETEEGKFYENSGTGVFNSNGGMQIKTGNTIHLISTISARPGYTFVGWNTKPDGSGTTFKQGEEVDASVLKSLGEDTVTLYAMWKAN